MLIILYGAAAECGGILLEHDTNVGVCDLPEQDASKNGCGKEHECSEC